MSDIEPSGLGRLACKVYIADDAPRMCSQPSVPTSREEIEGAAISALGRNHKVAIERPRFLGWN